jgi:FxsC-like protein
MARFFLSYARSNWEGGYLKRFLEDLCEDVRQFLLGQDASFRDNENTPLGAKWEPTLVEALHTCKAFVAVISPSYLGSEYCAKEWDAFNRRLERLAPGSAPPLILPVLWVPPTKNLPSAVTSLQYTIEQFGSEYAEKGLFTIIKNRSNYESAYQTFREGFRQALVDALTHHPLPDDPERPGFDQLSNPFDSAVAAQDHASAPNGPNHVRLAVVAGNRTELEPIRENVDPYGADAKAWAPFVNAEGQKQSLANRAQLVAALSNLTSDFVDLDNLMAEVESALQTNYLVAMLVDAWSLRLPKYRHKMKAYDQVQRVNCAVIIPEEEPPPGDATVKSALDQAIAQSFPNKTVIPPDPVSYRQGVQGAEFEQVLSDILIKLQARILQYRDVIRPVTGSGPAERPEISGVVP